MKLPFFFLYSLQLKPFIIFGENQSKKSSPNFMVIQITFLNLLRFEKCLCLVLSIFTLLGCLYGRRKILEGGTTFALLYMQKFRPKWLPSGEGKKNNCWPLAAERPAAAMFVLFVPSTRIFRANVVYMALRSSCLAARKILFLERS